MELEGVEAGAAAAVRAAGAATIATAAITAAAVAACGGWFFAVERTDSIIVCDLQRKKTVKVR